MKSLYISILFLFTFPITHAQWTPQIISPCPGTPTVLYEGKTYNTVIIGGQCWLKENLAVGTMINSSTSADSMRNNGIIEKYCYDNNPANCNTYGGLYQWNEAMQYVTNEGAQGICPPGWHLPTFAEFQTLETAVGGDGNALKAIGQGTGDGAGTNTSGFSALLAGTRGTSGDFYYLGSRANFWSSTEYQALTTPVLTLLESSSVIYLTNDGKGYGFSVRCIRDALVESINLNTPNGGENWQVGSSQNNIAWTSTNISNVKLEYTTNNGTNWIDITSVPASTGSYAWTIPNTPSTNCKVRVSDVTNSNTNDVSNSFFAISSIPINSCSGTPTVYYEGKTYNTVQIGDQCWLRENLDVGTIIPGAQNQSNNSTIEKYCYDNDPNNCNVYGGLYQWNEAMQYVMTEGAQGICPEGWHIPTLAEYQTLAMTVNNDGNELKEIGQGTGDGSGTNTSGFSALLAGDRYFEGGEYINLNQVLFFWTSTPQNGPYTLSMYSNNSEIGNYGTWANFGFSVRCLRDPIDSLSIISPDGGENWQVGSSQNITWTSSNVIDIRIELSINDGASYSEIVSSMPSTGIYNWTIPNTPSTNCKVRISDVTNSAIYDISNNAFTISNDAAISILTPNGGEILEAGSIYDVTWTSSNVIDIRIELSINNGASYSEIVSSTPSTGIYNWTVPNISSQQCLIKISDAINSSTFDLSNNVFRITSSTNLDDKFHTGIPNEFELYSNFPNPFNPSTNIEFGLPYSSQVRLSIHNTIGQEIQIILDEYREAGYHNINFDASNLISGIYFYTLEAGDFVQTKKMILLK